MKKIIVITGASSGIGLEFALQIDKMLKSVDEFYLIARRKDRLSALADRLSRPCRIIDGSLTENDVLDRLKDMLTCENVQIKMLVNAAGFGKLGSVSDLSIESQEEMTDLNCRALFSVTKTCIPYMSYNSRIINIASSASFLPQPGFAVYSATKAYVLSFTRALGRELINKKIYVTAVCPGPVDTEFFDTAIVNGEKPFYKDLVMADTEDVVRKALRDSICKKAVSVYGIPMKLFRIITKIIPHEFILRFLK